MEKDFDKHFNTVLRLTTMAFVFNLVVGVAILLVVLGLMGVGLWAGVHYLPLPLLIGNLPLIHCFIFDSPVISLGYLLNYVTWLKLLGSSVMVEL